MRVLVGLATGRLIVVTGGLIVVTIAGSDVGGTGTVAVVSAAVLVLAGETVANVVVLLSGVVGAAAPLVVGTEVAVSKVGFAGLVAVTPLLV